MLVNIKPENCPLNFQPLHLNGHYSVSYIFMKYFAFTSIQLGTKTKKGDNVVRPRIFYVL